MIKYLINKFKFVFKNTFAICIYFGGAYGRSSWPLSKGVVEGGCIEDGCQNRSLEVVPKIVVGSGRGVGWLVDEGG